MSENPANTTEIAKIDQLSPKRAIFVREYLIDLNGTQAAIRAGYSAKSAEQQASALLMNPQVKAAVEQVMAQRAKKLGISAEKVLHELDCMAHYDPGAIAQYNITRPACIPCLPEDLRRAIIGWGWDKAGNFTLKLSPKTSELTLIGKHLKLFTEKTDVNITGEIVQKIERTVIKPPKP